MSEIDWIIDWITSSHSDSQGGNCVQVAWKKSSASNSSGNCVQMALVDNEVWVRDSKHPEGPVLKFTGPEWEAFVAGVKDDQFKVT